MVMVVVMFFSFLLQCFHASLVSEVLFLQAKCERKSLANIVCGSVVSGSTRFFTVLVFD